MKKVISAIVTAFTVLTLCICLAACSESDEELYEANNIAGTYKFLSLTYYNVDGSVLLEFKLGDNDGFELDRDTYILTVEKDKTWTMESNLDREANIEERIDKGTWEYIDGKYILMPNENDFNGDEIVLDNTLNDGTLTLEWNKNGASIELVLESI